MRIVELRAENFKRITAVQITPDGSLVQITGRNGQGKSSVLDAIWATLGGKDASPPRPIRDGADEATVTLDLGTLKVTRRWTSPERSTLTVEGVEGARYSSPQAMLDKLVGTLSFDPLGFARMSDKEQAATLRELIKLDTSKDDAERARLFESRAAVNREWKQLQAQWAALEPDPTAPEAEISIAELTAKLRAAHEHGEANAKKQRLLGDSDRIVAEIQRDVARLETELAAARERLLIANEDNARFREQVANLKSPPSVRAIEDQLGEIETLNRRARARAERNAKQEAVRHKGKEADALTARIAEIDKRKAAALEAVRFPVQGLGVDGDLVTFNGVPFSQASSAEQLRVGLAMGAALNPTLRVVLVRDGSLLDADGLAFVASWAEEQNMQVIMERVAAGEACGVVIEDGHVQKVVQTPSLQPKGKRKPVAGDVIS